MTNRERLRLEHLCYANVLASFAFFHNPKYRGPGFSWDWWVENCVSSTHTWLLQQLHFVSEGTLKEAEAFTKAIATTAVSRMME